jgi:hypothetical protein
VLPLEALEPGVARCEPRVLCLELLGFDLDLLDRFPLLQNPLLERVLPHSFVDRWMPTYCSMAVATAAAMQGIPACCGMSMEVAPRIETCGESAQTAVQQNVIQP